MRRVLSAEDEARRRPSLENFTEEMAFLWPVMVWERVYGVKGSVAVAAAAGSVDIFGDFKEGGFKDCSRTELALN